MSGTFQILVCKLYTHGTIVVSNVYPNTRTHKTHTHTIHSIPVHKIANFWYFPVLYVRYKHMALLFNNNDQNNNTNIIILTIICEKIYKYKVYKYKVENTLKSKGETPLDVEPL